MRISLIILLFLLAAYQSFSQGNRLNEKNSIGWFSAIVTPTITKKISLHTEYQWRRVNFLKHWQQSLLRAGVTYKANPQVAFQLGYAWAQSFPYGTYNVSSVARDFPEHRIYEQVVLQTPVGKSTLINRFRLEQRWVGRFASVNEQEPSFLYLNRFRFMPRIDHPFSTKWYGSVYDEIFIGFGKNVGENVFDQNRIGVLVGFKPSPKYKIEVGYLNQTVQLGREIENKNVFQSNNGIIINTFLNL